MSKSANQLYRESGTSLPFKEWIEREKNKGIFIKNEVLADITGDTKEEEKDTSFAKFDVGIPKWVVVAGVVVIVGAVIYRKYRE